MSLANKALLSRPRSATLAPAPLRSDCRLNLNLCKTRVLNKQRPGLSEVSTSYTDSSDDARLSSDGSGDAARNLFDDRHIPVWTPELMLYAPLGVILATFRSALWILGIALDQAWFRNQNIVDAYLRLLGVTVTWRHGERIPPGRHLMVSNHCSVGDLMILFSHPTLPQRYTHLITNSLPARVTRAAHLPVIMRPASPATYDQLAAASSASGPDTSPIHLFPEGGMTNGRGMMRFSRGFMRILQQQQQPLQPDQQHLQQHVRPLHEQQGGGLQPQAAAAAAALPVVPVALRVRGSVPGVVTHTLRSSFLANLFWFGFSPSMELEATVLPPMTPLTGEARGAFVRRVQAAIAEELGVEVYDMTIQQKRQLAAQQGRAQGRVRVETEGR